MHIRLPPNPTPEQMEAAYAADLLRKGQLVHGAYYSGQCRNATVARWHAGAQCFVHWLAECGELFLECIRHPEDERRYDAFLPERIVDPGADAIPDADFELRTAAKE